MRPKTPAAAPPPAAPSPSAPGAALTPAQQIAAATAQRRVEEQEDLRRRAAAEKVRLESEEQELVLRREREARIDAEDNARTSRGEQDPVRSLAAEDAMRAAAEGSTVAPVSRGEWAALATTSGGYNDAVEQTADAPGSTVFTKRPAAFIGLDLTLVLQLTGARSYHDFRVQGRGQKYFSTAGDYDFSPDGTLNAMYQGRFSTGRNTTLAIFAGDSLSSLNSARLSDGVVYRIDPDATKRTVNLATARADLTQELDARLRFEQSVSASVSSILEAAPTTLANGSQYTYTGFDFLNVGTSSTLTKSFDKDNEGFLRLRYYFAVNRGFPDYSQVPPPDPGFVENHGGDAYLGLSHLFTERFSSRSSLGGSFAFPLQAGTSTSFAPYVDQSFSYIAPRLSLRVGGGYNLGVVGPAVGVGSSLYANFNGRVDILAGGGPFQSLQFLVNATATRAEIPVLIDQTSNLRYVLAAAELRYGIAPSVALSAGYSFRWSEYFVPPQTITPFVRNVVYVGLTFYMTSIRGLPALTNFTPVF